MADRTSIEWTDATWNPIVGCSVVSPGCTNCYAMRLAGTRLKHLPSRAGLTRDTKAGPVWTGETRFDEKALTQPLRWRSPRRIFVNSMSDLFHESVADEWIDKIFAVMALCPQHTFQLLTKRPARMRSYLRANPGIRIRSEMPRLVGPIQVIEMDWPLPNVWLGVTTEDQPRADERIPILLDTPAAVRFVSIEPMLGAMNIGEWMPGCHECTEACGWRSASAPPREKCHHCGMTSQTFGEFCPLCGHQDFGAVCPVCEADAVQHHPDTPCLDWVICGGESGPGARPMHPDWARSLRDQCAAGGVPFLFKQWGEWAPGECASGAQTRSERGAWYFNGRWDQRTITPREGGEMHIDDEPDVWRVGKRAAGRLLDGIEHNAYPEVSTCPAA